MTDILNDLQARGLLVQRSHQEEFDEHLFTVTRTVYCGFDPTAPSLHIGNLVPLLALRRFQLAGHRPIILVGGATGLIGDPSGRDEERQLNDENVVSGWVNRLSSQVNRFVSFEGENAALVVNNYDWACKISLIDFLRDIGKHFSVNALVQREAVKSRLSRKDAGISYTEFSYALVQALDFLQLYREFDCTVQLGGQDQWGNIVSGIDLIRRVEGGESYALTFPLVERSDGKKFGKSTGGAIWLDPKLTSPYAFYQFWMNLPDSDVGPFLGYFTFKTMAEIAEIVESHSIEPAKRAGQRLLAREVTELVHGGEGVASAERITDALFQGDITALTSSDLEQLQLDGVEVATVSEDCLVTEALVDLGLSSSKSRARQLVDQGGITVNSKKIEDSNASLTASNALHGRFHLIRRGRKTWALAVHQDIENS